MPKSRFISKSTHINSVIQYFTLSDLLILSAWGLLMPFFAVFIISEVNGGSIAAAGFATTLMLIVRSIFLMPIGEFLDRNKGEKDDFLLLVIGSLIVSAVALGYIFVTEMWHIYLLQVIHGLGSALTFPSYGAIFSRHLDKHKEAFEWSFYDTLVGIGTALTATTGGLIIDKFGYESLFVIVSLLSFAGTFFIIATKSDLLDE